MTFWDWICLVGIIVWAFWPWLRYWYTLYRAGSWARR